MNKFSNEFREINFDDEAEQLEGISKLILAEFQNKTNLDSFYDNTMKTVLELPPRKRIELGIAFHTIEIFELARRIFESVYRYEDHKIEGLYLLATTLVASGQASEATLKLEPYVRDLTLDDKSKTDLLYMMGIAFEKLNDIVRAQEFYKRVYLINPKYRNVSEKIK